jgi:hypothetical protein
MSEINSQVKDKAFHFQRKSLHLVRLTGFEPATFGSVEPKHKFYKLYLFQFLPYIVLLCNLSKIFKL